MNINNSPQTKTKTLARLKLLGARSGAVCFYLPNPPELTPQMRSALILEQKATSGIQQQLTNNGITTLPLQAGNIDALIELNGNHWRKIFIIMAKICAPDEQWRNYMPSLLSKNEKICFNAEELDANGSVHIICGAQSCQNLGIKKPEAREINVLTPQSNKNEKGVVITTPYLDYRQFPNRLIEQTRQVLYSPH